MKLVKETVRKYYKYSTGPFVQPIINSDGTLGGDRFACYCSTPNAYYPPYLQFDGNSTTFGVLGYGTGYLIVYNPEPLCITEINFLKYGLTGVTAVSGSNDNSTWESITSSTTVSGSNVITTLTNTDFYNYYKIETTGSGNYYSCETYITADVKVAVESNMHDYDFYKDVEVYELPIKLKNRTYYKYAIGTWTQIVPANDGIIGTGNFACYSSVYSSNFYPYKAFQNSNSSYWGCYGGYAPIQYMGFWSKNPLCVTQIDFCQPDSSYYMSGFQIQASNDSTNGANGTWTLLYEQLPSGGSAGTGADVSATISNTNYYKFYKIVWSDDSTAPAGQGCYIANLQITATEQTIISGTASDYDFYKDTNTYYTVKG